MSFLKNLLFKEPKALPMHPGNVLIISSSAREMHEVVHILCSSKNNYHTNSEVIRLDNGDFAQVVAQTHE